MENLSQLTDTLCEDPRWDKAGLSHYAERAAQATLMRLDLEATAYEIAVLGCDDARIAALNGDFRQKPQPTNVLSWPSQDLAPDTPGGAPFPPDPEDDPHHLGDIAIAFDTCAREAAEQAKAFEAHVSHLLVHGVLHLLGYDHIHDADSIVMERLEREIVGNLGYPDPYNGAYGAGLAENGKD